ncbi:MAG: response regulator transcription factor [Thermomicrobiales bacterium]
MRILVIEDEPELANFIGKGLRQAGFAVDLAADGEIALEKAASTFYDAVVLDRRLPGMHGDDVCRQLLATSPAPRILMLTAASEISARVDGLALGADDYMPKPFAMEELIARLRALGRRPATVIPAVLTFGDLRIDTARWQATRNDEILPLTRKEFSVLEAIVSANGRVVSAEELLERIWNEETDPFTNVIRVTIMNLRRKLGDPPLIETIVGVGYRLRSLPTSS